MLTSNYQRISLFLCTFSNFVNYEADANQLLNDSNLSQQLYTKINGLKSAITDYEYNEDMHKWVLDEEEIYVPNRMTHQTTLYSTHSEQWWRATSEDDPAMDAEPVPWDGKGLYENVSSNLFQDYEVIQNTWEEDAVL
ncbi:hypothetical protein OTU49_016421 [Cherax quadricarinatus]|uniref:Uncharacterized protein n=1 Tax=Cherax quadricarinatus TaxID=27406 RepID=A0AAW0YCH2_CHEQU